MRHHPRPRGRVDLHRAKWKKALAAAEAGDDPELVEMLRGAGIEHRWLSPPSESDEMSARIRIEAGRGSQADRDVLRARGRGRERQGKLTFRAFP